MCLILPATLENKRLANVPMGHQVTQSNTLLGVVEEVRTQTPQKEWDRIVANIRTLRAHFEPESVVKKPVRRRRAGGA